MKQTLRQLGRSPGFVILAVLTLSLGIGFSSSSFSLSNVLLLRNLPYPHADRLVRIFSSSPQSPRNGHSPGNIVAVRDAVKSYSHFSIYSPGPYSLVQPGKPPERVFVMAATADFFNVTGVHPDVGRDFCPKDVGQHVAVITHRAWVRYYGADRDIIGRTIRLNTEPYTIIGVLPKRFDAPVLWGTVDFIVPEIIDSGLRQHFTGSWMQAVALLKPGVSLQQAQAELNTIATRLKHDHPKVDARLGLTVVPLHSSGLDNVSRDLLWLMTGLSLAMLLIACVNLASLQVARAFARTREFALRAALGGTRRHLMAPLLVESLLLAFAGGVGGMLIALWSNDLLGRFLMVGNQFGFKIPVDGRVLAFAAAAALVSGLVFGLAPAWLASRSPAAEVLKEGSRSSAGSRSQHRLKQVLIVCELAVALALVGVAGAFGFGVRSFLHRNFGWDMNHLFQGVTALPTHQYEHDKQVLDFKQAVLSRLKTIPGIEHPALAKFLPLGGYGDALPVTVEGQPSDGSSAGPTAERDVVTPGYFAALHIPLKRGDLFTENLTAKDRRVAVVNERFARRFWPNSSAIGQRVRLGSGDHWCEIIGVVGNVKMAARLGQTGSPLQIYVPFIQNPTRYFTIVARTKLNPAALSLPVRKAVATVDPDLPIADTGSVRTNYDLNMHNLELVIVNLGIYAAMGLLIAAIGLFGVISQLTVQRTRDIGVRMALGAPSGTVLKMILGEGVRLFSIGMIVGIPSYLALVGILRHAVPAMPLPGYWLLGVNVAVFAAATLLASFLPARHASRINPVEALRAE